MRIGTDEINDGDAVEGAGGVEEVTRGAIGYLAVLEVGVSKVVSLLPLSNVVVLLADTALDCELATTRSAMLRANAFCFLLWIARRL